MFGCFLGLAESWSLFFTDRRLLKIPQIHQHVSATIRSNAVSLIKNSLTDTGKYYLAYLFFYLIFGETISSRLVRLTRLQVEEPLNNLMGLLSISLAYQYILVGAFCIVTIRLSNLLFQLFQMKVRLSVKENEIARIKRFYVICSQCRSQLPLTLMIRSPYYTKFWLQTCRYFRYGDVEIGGV